MADQRFREEFLADAEANGAPAELVQRVMDMLNTEMAWATHNLRDLLAQALRRVVLEAERLRADDVPIARELEGTEAMTAAAVGIGIAYAAAIRAHLT